MSAARAESYTFTCLTGCCDYTPTYHDQAVPDDIEQQCPDLTLPASGGSSVPVGGASAALAAALASALASALAAVLAAVLVTVSGICTGSCTGICTGSCTGSCTGICTRDS